MRDTHTNSIIKVHYIWYAFLLTSLSVSLSFFILAIPMHECSGKHLCMSFPFPIAILNGTCFFPTVQLQVQNVYLGVKN